MAAVLLPALVLILVAWRMGRRAAREQREEQAGRSPGDEGQA
jgi:hypothetical protein